MRQVIVIHGGESFATYEEFWTYLNETVLHLDRLKLHDWKHGLQRELGESYEVIAPRMPNSLNAKYAEWKVWFEKLIPQLDDSLILVGHSMGGVFLAKYLSLERFPKRILGTILVAAPFDLDGDHALHEFAISNDLVGFTEQSERIFLYQSEDDPVVAFTELAKYQACLPGATVRIFKDREHFNQESLPEILTDIRSLG